MRDTPSMRIGSLLVALALVVTIGVLLADVTTADTGSISRDSRGTSVYGTSDPLGGPPTPRVYGIGQSTIFIAGITLLAAAAVLGVYTFMAERRPGARR